MLASYSLLDHDFSLFQFQTFSQLNTLFMLNTVLVPRPYLLSLRGKVWVREQLNTYSTRCIVLIWVFFYWLSDLLSGKTFSHFSIPTLPPRLHFHLFFSYLLLIAPMTSFNCWRMNLLLSWAAQIRLSIFTSPSRPKVSNTHFVF